MFRAIGCISSGRDSGMPPTQTTSSERGILQASANEMPRTKGALAASESLEPPQSGQISVLRNFSTRFIPFSSLTLARAFSTVYTAL